MSEKLRQLGNVISTKYPCRAGVLLTRALARRLDLPYLILIDFVVTTEVVFDEPDLLV